MQYQKQILAFTLVSAVTLSTPAQAEGLFSGLFKKKEKPAVSKKTPEESDVTRAANTRDLLNRKNSERAYQQNVIRKVTEDGGDGGTDPMEEHFSFLKGSGIEGITVSYGSKHFMYNGKTLDEFLYKNSLGDSAVADNGLLKTKVEKAGGDVYTNGFQMNAVQSALYTAAIQYFAETPIFGGDPSRGFHPIIWPAMVKVAFENRLVMLPSGELLYPADPEFKYMVTGQKPENSRRVNLSKAHVVLTDHSGNIVGENFRPIEIEALEDADGGALVTSKMNEEMEEYSNGLRAFNMFGAMTLNTNLDFSPFVRRASETARMDKIEGPRQTWIGCVGKLFRGLFSKAKRAEAHECFKLNKDQAMADALTPGLHEPFLNDLAVGMGRGAASGFAVTALTGGMDLGGGTLLGAVMNGMRVTYNRYFKKEVITPQQIRDLQNFVDKYTFAPNSYGEVMPRTGAWMVRDGQTLIRYKTMAGFRRNNKTGEDIATEAQILLDLNGNPRSANAGLKIDNLTQNVKALGRDNPEDFQRQREALKQIDRLSKIQDKNNTPGQNPALPVLK